MLMKCLLQARPDTGTRGLMVALTGGLPRVARKHTGCLVKFEYKITTKILSISIFHAIFGTYLY